MTNNNKTFLHKLTTCQRHYLTFVSCKRSHVRWIKRTSNNSSLLMDKNFKPYIISLLKYVQKLQRITRYHSQAMKSVTRAYLAKPRQNLTIGKKLFVLQKINTLKYSFYLLKTLVDGSFKHYKKIVILLGLNSKFNMELINIE